MFDGNFWIGVIVLIIVLLVLITRKIFRIDEPVYGLEEDLETQTETETKKIELSEEELRKLIPTEILIEAQRSNTASGSVAEGTDEFQTSTEKVEVLSSGIKIRIKGKGGTRGPKLKTKTPKEKFDVNVSNLRRFFHNEGVSAEDAEKAIDVYLLDMEAFSKYGYVKSKRRPPRGGYAPLN